MPAILRRFLLVLAPCVVVSGLAGAQQGAPTASACAGGDALSQASCERAQLVRSICDDVPAEARGHCVRCLLANNPLACDALPPEAAGRCRAQEAVIARCTEGPVEAAEACMRRQGAALSTPAASSPKTATATATATPSTFPTTRTLQ